MRVRRAAVAVCIILASPVVAPTANAQSPPLVHTFPGASVFDGQDMSIAAGPGGLVSTTNGGLALLARDGTPLATTSPTAFFQRTTSGDARVIYDPHSGRFFAVALAFDGTFPFVVSTSSTPANLDTGTADTDDWRSVPIDYSVAAGFVDFPGLGVDRDNIYITALVLRPVSASLGRG